MKIDDSIPRILLLLLLHFLPQSPSFIIIFLSAVSRLAGGAPTTASSVVTSQFGLPHDRFPEAYNNGVIITRSAIGGSSNGDRNKSSTIGPGDDQDTQANQRDFISLKFPFRDRIRPGTETKGSPFASVKRHPVVNYESVFHNNRNGSKMTSNAVLPTSVNLMILPLGAIFVFIVLVVLSISRWCMENIREADSIISHSHNGIVRTGFAPAGPTHRFQTTSQRSPDRLRLPGKEGRRPGGGGGGNGGANSHPALDLLRRSAPSNQTRLPRQTRIVPARSTRSLNVLRCGGGGRDRITKRLLAIGSDLSIPMTELTSSSRHFRHQGDRSMPVLSADGVAVDSCRRAVGSFLQSHVIVLPVDKSAAGSGSGNVVGLRTRTRNFSSPSSSSTNRNGSSGSESRPLLARGSSSSDSRMTSSDSNIDVTSPSGVRRRMAAGGDASRCYRTTKPAYVNSAGNLANRIVALQHGGGGRGHVTGKMVGGYNHGFNLSSTPAVSKLVHESLNLSFRFFQVPLYSNSSSGKESLDSVFVCGIYADESASPPTPGGYIDIDQTKAEADAEINYGATELPVFLREGRRKASENGTNREEKVEFYSPFDRQMSTDDSEKEACDSSQNLPEFVGCFDVVRYHARMSAIERPISGDAVGATLRRCVSANELHYLGRMRKEPPTGSDRSTKCRTA